MLILKCVKHVKRQLCKHIEYPVTLIKSYKSFYTWDAEFIFFSQINSFSNICYTAVKLYSAQRYCSSYSWWNWWCWSHAYRSISNYSMKKICCPGYQGSDCATPICNPACKQGYSCTSPKTCEPDSIPVTPKPAAQDWRRHKRSHI